MKKAEVDDILKTATKEQAVKIRILHAAVVDSMKAYNQTHQPKFLRAWKTAENELQEYCNSIDNQTDGPSTPTDLKKMINATMPTDAIATVFGVTRSRIRQLTAEGMPKAGRNAYLLPACVQWYANFLRTKAADADDELKQERIRYLKAKAQSATIDADLKKESVVLIDEVERIWADHINVAKTKLLSLPSTFAATLAHITDPKKIQAEARQKIDEVLHDLADYRPKDK